VKITSLMGGGLYVERPRGKNKTWEQTGFRFDPGQNEKKMRGGPNLSSGKKKKKMSHGPRPSQGPKGERKNSKQFRIGMTVARKANGGGGGHKG